MLNRLAEAAVAPIEGVKNAAGRMEA